MSEKVNNEKVNETAKAVSLEAAEEVKTPKVEAAPAAEKKEVVEEELATATVASPVAEKEATTVEEVVEEKKSRLPTAADLLADDVVEPIKRKKGSKNVPVGIAFVKTTFNNTIVSITDMRGNVISWSSAGRCNFKGSRKSTAFAATTVAQDAARTAISHGMSEVEVRVQGPGAGRESAVRAIQSSGLSISVIKDTTAIPHNGCRPPKRRRV
ncbi:MAG TPA: 30S ribosomal protein S11 [Verrucomicrobia bacterium]|nr:30S ribosomal protein S11 [Verrucomicrobiota bacterium]|tara:strand:- start:309 stop:944 length:636 start_codon:yes stop_codon:yes gene_type:complete